jgi:hypothetical protein
MMLREFLTLPKTITTLSGWSDKKMPKTNSRFPLSKNKGLRLGAGWIWTVIGLTAGDQTCRLLIALHSGKENYQAILGYESEADTQVIGCLEYHGTYAGWHVHGCCSPAEKATVGRLRYPAMTRLPDGKSRHRRTEFGVTETDALRPAIQFFKLQDALDAWDK